MNYLYKLLLILFVSSGALRAMDGAVLTVEKVDEPAAAKEFLEARRASFNGHEESCQVGSSEDEISYVREPLRLETRRDGRQKRVAVEGSKLAKWKEENARQREEERRLGARVLTNVPQPTHEISSDDGTATESAWGFDKDKEDRANWALDVAKKARDREARALGLEPQESSQGGVSEFDPAPLPIDEEVLEAEGMLSSVYVEARRTMSKEDFERTIGSLYPDMESYAKQQDALMKSREAQASSGNLQGDEQSAEDGEEESEISVVQWPTVPSTEDVNESSVYQRPPPPVREEEETESVADRGPVPSVPDESEHVPPNSRTRPLPPSPSLVPSGGANVPQEIPVEVVEPNGPQARDDQPGNGSPVVDEAPETIDLQTGEGQPGTSENVDSEASTDESPTIVSLPLPPGVEEGGGGSDDDDKKGNVNFTKLFGVSGTIALVLYIYMHYNLRAESAEDISVLLKPVVIETTKS